MAVVEYAVVGPGYANPLTDIYRIVELRDDSLGNVEICWATTEGKANYIATALNATL